jgi:hypothetical protein
MKLKRITADFTPEADDVLFYLFVLLSTVIVTPFVLEIFSRELTSEHWSFVGNITAGLIGLLGAAIGHCFRRGGNC